MAESSTCQECGGRLGVKATRCRCGWVMPGAPTSASVPAAKLISCCYSSCLEGAICRVWTKTGWANVCKSHYPKVERLPPPIDSQFARDCRAAYERSHHFRRLKGGDVVPGTIAAALPREPGSDDDLPLGIARDALEVEFGAQP